MADGCVYLVKDYIIQAVIDTFEQGLEPSGVKVVLSKNWHFNVGEIVHPEMWEEMGFFTAAGMEELISNLPSFDDVKRGSVRLSDIRSGNYDWQLIDEYKNIKIIWQ